jgi:hypothetical protein
MNGYRCHQPLIRMIPFIILLLLILPLLVEAAEQNPLKVRLIVKENAGVGAGQYPVSAVVPLPQGRCADPKGLGVAEVPSQVEVLERWPGDQSLRHVLVHFQPSVKTSGTSTYNLIESEPIAPGSPVTVLEGGDNLTITTGQIGRAHV